jgi:hypothetical protein
MSIYLVTTLVTAYAICVTAIAWTAITVVRDQARDSTRKVTEALQAYMRECAEFDRAVPERDDVWADPRCSHRGADCNCPAGTCQFVTAPTRQQNKQTLQEQINAVLTDRINALESYRRNHAQRLNDVEEALAETGDDVSVTWMDEVGRAAQDQRAYAVATGHLDARMRGDMDFGDDAQTDWANHQKNYREAARSTIAEMFEVRDVTDYEAELMMAARQREAEEKLVPGTLHVIHDPHGQAIEQLDRMFSHQLADKIFMADDLDYTQPMTTVVTESPNKDFDPEATQPICGPDLMVDFYLPQPWSDGDQTVVDVQQEVRDGWSNG